jgi:hypothetical protein
MPRGGVIKVMKSMKKKMKDMANRIAVLERQVRDLSEILIPTVVEEDLFAETTPPAPPPGPEPVHVWLWFRDLPETHRATRRILVNIDMKVSDFKDEIGAGLDPARPGSGIILLDEFGEHWHDTRRIRDYDVMDDEIVRVHFV